MCEKEHHDQSLDVQVTALSRLYSERKELRVISVMLACDSAHNALLMSPRFGAEARSES